MTPYQHLQFEGQRLGAGSHRILCPFCDGGTERERSLNLLVGSTGSIYFRCFRASCDTRGGKYERKSTKREPRYFTAETVSLNDDRKCWLVERFGCLPSDTVYSPLLDRYIYKVSGPRMQARGYVARSFSGAKPKVLTYNERPDEPFIGWAFADVEASFVVMVEDWASAEKVAASGISDAVALNGTHLTLDMVQEIAEYADGRPVVLALDADAFGKSLKYALEYGGMFSPRLKVWRLGCDLKYVSLEEIRKALLDGTTDFTREPGSRAHATDERRATDTNGHNHGATGT